MRISKLLAPVSIVLAIVLATNVAFAGPPTDLVRAKQTELFELIKQPRTAVRQEKLRALFDALFAYEEIAREALKSQWDELSADQRTRYVDLLTSIVRNNYRRNLQRMRDYTIRYVGEEDGSGGTWVKTEAHHKTDTREPPIEVDFMLRSVGGKLVVVDLSPEGASLVKTYRVQFKRILKKDGFEGLLKKLQKKRDKQERELD